MLVIFVILGVIGNRPILSFLVWGSVGFIGKLWYISLQATVASPRQSNQQNNIDNLARSRWEWADRWRLWQRHYNVTTESGQPLLYRFHLRGKSMNQKTSCHLHLLCCVRECAQSSVWCNRSMTWEREKHVGGKILNRIDKAKVSIVVAWFKNIPHDELFYCSRN